MKMRTAPGRLFAVLALWSLTMVSAGAGEEKHTYAFDWSAEVSYPGFGHAGVDGQIRDWVRTTMQSCLPVGPGSLEPGDGFPEDGFEMTVGYETTRPSDSVVSVAFTIVTCNKGAAHPLTRIWTGNYSLADGGLLTLDRLFRDPGKALAIFAENAPALINARFREAPGNGVDRDLGENDWFKEGFEPAPGNYNALGLEPEGVRVYFQQYQVLPYAFGIPDPLFPLEMLAPAGPNETIWPKK